MNVVGNSHFVLQSQQKVNCINHCRGKQNLFKLWPEFSSLVLYYATYHLLSVKMKDIQVISNRLPPRKCRESEEAARLVEACLCPWAGDTSGWTNTKLHVSISGKHISFWPFYYLWTEMGPSIIAPAVYKHNLRKKQQALVRINSVSDRLQQQNKRCVHWCFFARHESQSCTSEKSQVLNINRKCRLGEVLVIKTVSTPLQTAISLMKWKRLVLSCWGMSQTMRWISGGDKGQNILMSLPISEFILSLKGLLTYIRDCLKIISGERGQKS